MQFIFNFRFAMSSGKIKTVEKKFNFDDDTTFRDAVTEAVTQCRPSDFKDVNGVAMRINGIMTLTSVNLVEIVRKE